MKINDAEKFVMELSQRGINEYKSGDLLLGKNFLEKALTYSIHDLKTLSAIYSHLGIVNYLLKNYPESIIYHQKDLEASKQINDDHGEGVANNNLGNVLQIIGKYDEAIECYKKFLNISIKLGKDESCSEALYNLGKVYHEKAKGLGALGRQTSAQFPPYIEEVLNQALDYYKDALKASKLLDNQYMQIAILGNLGNIQFLLGNYIKSVKYQTEKIKISKHLCDLRGQLNGHINRGNVFIIMESFESAIDDFQTALLFAIELKEISMKKKIYFALGNTYFTMGLFKLSETNIKRFLELAEQSKDFFGVARAFSCLSCINCRKGSYDLAYINGKKYLEFAEKLEDVIEIEIALKNIETIDGMKFFLNDSIYKKFIDDEKEDLSKCNETFNEVFIPSIVKEMTQNNKNTFNTNSFISKENFFFLLKKFHIVKKQKEQSEHDIEKRQQEEENYEKEKIIDKPKIEVSNIMNKGKFLKVLGNVQSQRMNNQRSDFNPTLITKEYNSTENNDKELNTKIIKNNIDKNFINNTSEKTKETAKPREALLELISKSHRMNDQRRSFRQVRFK